MKTRLSALAVTISSISMLTACSGGASNPTFTASTPTPTPTPTVTVTAPATATAGVAFDVAWTSTDAASCAADFDSATGATGSVSKTETVTGTAIVTKTYTVTCTGAGGSATGNASVAVSPNATAQGAWQGTVGSRALSGVVTDQSNYWLAYSTVANAAVPAGFYAGQGSSEADGTFPSSDLREFNFEGAGAKQGTVAATYTQSVGYTSANTLAGNFVGGGNIFSLTMTGDNQFDALQGYLVMNFTGTWNADTNSGTMTGNTHSRNADPSLPPVLDLALTYTQTFTMDETTGAGKLNQIDLANCTDGTAGACAGISGALKGNYFNNVGSTTAQYKAKVPFTPTDGGVYQWTFQFNAAGTDSNGDPIIVYTPVPTTVTLHGPTLPSITTAAFTSTYNAAYELTPSVDTVAGTDYTATPAYTGIGSAMYTNTTTFSISSGGAISGAESTSGCSYAGTIAPHVTNSVQVGNVYDVTALTFTGGSCAYTASGTFTGAATYDATAKKLTLTATNAAHDKGFMVVVARP